MRTGRRCGGRSRPGDRRTDVALAITRLPGQRRSHRGRGSDGRRTAGACDRCRASSWPGLARRLGARARSRGAADRPRPGSRRLTIGSSDGNAAPGSDRDRRGRELRRSVVLFVSPLIAAVILIEATASVARGCLSWWSPACSRPGSGARLASEWAPGPGSIAAPSRLGRCHCPARTSHGRAVRVDDRARACRRGRRPPDHARRADDAQVSVPRPLVILPIATDRGRAGHRLLSGHRSRANQVLFSGEAALPGLVSRRGRGRSGRWFC